MNVFELPDGLLPGELVERVAGGEDVLVERIVSRGHATPTGAWLEQDRDEWVVVLQGDAELAYADRTRVPLGRGEHVVIPAGVRHRVERTSTEPPCIWLAVHADGLSGR